MFLSRVALSLNALSRVPGAVTASVAVRQLCSPPSARCYSTAPAGSPQAPQRWTALDPELEEALVPRMMSVSPLESWLSLRYSLPPLPGAEVAPPVDRGSGDLSTLLPPAVEPVLGGWGEGSPATPLSCKNVLEIRRRKMNRHQYRKLRKRTIFQRRKVMHSRRKRKQRRFERDLKRICIRAGLKKALEGWSIPKIYIRLNKSKSSN